MPMMLKDLIIDRVDLVDEGANSAAHVRLYKRKEIQSTMTIQELITQNFSNEEDRAAALAAIDALVKEKDVALAKLEETNTQLVSTQEELATVKEQLQKADKVKPFDEEETLKSMPENVRQTIEVLKAQKIAAEEELRKAKEEKATAEAVAKAASLKALPVAQGQLVDLVKGCSATMLDTLTAINAAIEATTLSELGKNKANSVVSTANDAWAAITKKAEEIAARDKVTISKAISTVIKENPKLYNAYLQGGAN